MIFLYTKQFNLVTNKLEEYHITNLRPFEYDPLKVDPRIVGNVNQDMGDIDIIPPHTGEPNRKERWRSGMGVLE